MMSNDLWTRVDRYFESGMIRDAWGLDAALQACDAAGLPAISVSPLQGKFLHLLARLMGARRVLEIGTLGGYSTIWLAGAVAPDGHVVTMELDARHADVARRNLAAAGLAAVVEVRVGPAKALLDALIAERSQPFDLVFIDADKPSIADYVERSLALSRPGTCIVVDNVVRDGKVIDGSSTDASVQGVRRFVEQFGGHPRLNMTALQTVGVKGHDGLAMAMVR